jgi:uncharacterized protein
MRSRIMMYEASVPVFRKMLANCGTFLSKADLLAKARGLSPAELVNTRLCPDMFALGRQVIILTDGARGCAEHLCGISQEDSNFAVFDRGADSDFEDEEYTLPDLTKRECPGRC